MTIQIFGTRWQESQCEESRLRHKTSMTSKININQYKPSRTSSHISNYFIITLLIAQVAHRLSIVRYCFRFAPLLHSCITYRFSYMMHLRKYSKELQMSLYRHINFSYLCSIQVALSLQIVEKKLHSPLISSLRKQLSPTTNILTSASTSTIPIAHRPRHIKTSTLNNIALILILSLSSWYYHPHPQSLYLIYL
jgi:hypothetical protein